MSLLKGDPITQLAFSVYENKGIFAALLGSGISRSAEIPTGWEITLDLVRRIALTQGVEDQPDWAAWYRDKTGLEPNYSTLLEEIAISPDERRAILHRYIEPSEEDRRENRKVPTKAHYSIANLVSSGHIRVIITTNFDRLMENALREQGIEPTVISSVDALAGAEPLTHSRCYLIKLHGDYKDARILNTDQELSAYPEEYSRLLDRVLDEHGLIICGWSGEWDHALRADFLRSSSRRYPFYWATRSGLGSGAAEIAAHKQARHIPILSADAFFQSLQQRIETLEQSQRQNPLSIDLLVSSAKRYIAKPEHRIHLDDLITQESDRLMALLDGDAFTPQGQWSSEIFQNRIQLYESAAEPLARLAGVLGRWGDDNELGLILEVLRALHRHAGKVGNGITALLNLRMYPAVLVFTAYGIGLTKAQRWKSLYRLFSATLNSEHREPERIVSKIFLSAWDGGEQRLWQNLKGFERRKTPLSDRLLEIMTNWKSSFSGLDSDFELLFSRFEILGALAYLDQNSEAQLENELAAKPNDLLAWMPMGRIGWNGSYARKLTEELQDDEFANELFSAGFSLNSRRFLEIFIENFKRFSRRMSWM